MYQMSDALAGPAPTQTARQDPRQPSRTHPEADRADSLGEVEGFRISLLGAEDKLAQIYRRTKNGAVADLGIPTRPKTE